MRERDEQELENQEHAFFVDEFYVQAQEKLKKILHEEHGIMIPHIHPSRPNTEDTAYFKILNPIYDTEMSEQSKKKYAHTEFICTKNDTGIDIEINVEPGFEDL